MSGELRRHDLSHVVWREYEWTDPVTGNRVTYRIDAPQALWLRPDSTTHRILDATGTFHLVPSVGQLGCVVRWQSDSDEPKF